MRVPRWLFLVLVAGLLAACRTSLVSDLVTGSGGVLFQDDFTDPASGWSRAANPASRTGVMDYDHGTFRILVTAPDYDLWSVPGQEFGDVRVEAGATRLGGPDENRFGLICRYQDAGDFYFFIVSSDGYYAIGKVRQGKRTLLGQPMMAYSSAVVPGAGPNRLRFDCIGPGLSGSVNGRLVAITQDGDFSHGDVGLLAGSFATPGVDVAFDHFIVIKP